MGLIGGYGRSKSLLLAVSLWWLVVRCSLSQDGSVLNEHLVVLGTDADGMAAVFIDSRWGDYDHANYPFATSSGAISPACSVNGLSNRCRKLPIMKSGRGFVLLAPLQDAVGLMELQYNGRELLKERDFTLSLSSALSSDNCIPLDIIMFEDRPTVLCLENMQTLQFCIVTVDQENISQSKFSLCAELYTLASPADYQTISNFVLYEDQVVFASEGIILGIRFDRLDARAYSSLNDTSCSRLEYAGDQIFYAYCESGQTLRYNIDSLQVENAGLLMPFVCSRSDQTLFTIQQTSQATIIRYNNRNYRTPGLNFTFAECYNNSLFLLLDSIKGTSAFHQDSNSLKLFSNSSRDQSFEVFDGPYTVVHRTDPKEALLYDPSFEQVAIIVLDGAASVAVITNLSVQLPTTTEKPAVSAWYSRGGGIALWTVLALLVIAVPTAVIGILCCCCYSRRKNYNVRNKLDHDLQCGHKGSNNLPACNTSSTSTARNRGSIASTGDGVGANRNPVADGQDSEDSQLENNQVNPAPDHYNREAARLVAQQ